MIRFTALVLATLLLSLPLPVSACGPILELQPVTNCRGGGEHARGCWVVDMILGKR